MSKILIDPGEVDRIWTEIWHLNNDNKSEDYDGLSQKKKDQLRKLFYDLLNQDAMRGSDGETGDGSSPEAPSQEKELKDPPEGYDPAIHDPALYAAANPAAPRLWIPEAVEVPKGKTFGLYPKKYPEGVIWHFTAGHRNGLESGNNLMRESPYMYFLVDKEGKIAQSNPLDQRGYHSGKSSWPGIGSSVHNRLTGIEVQAWGSLTKKGSTYYSWAGYKVPESEVIYSPKRGNIQSGYYHMYTTQQCKTLRRVTLWMHLNNPNTFKIANVVGHDEVAPTRKNDPGAAYCIDGNPLTMTEVRVMLLRDDEIIRELQSRSI